MRMRSGVRARSVLAAVGVVGIALENHRGATSLGSGLAPLGHIVAGIGNGVDCAVDGVLTEHIIGTYLHGPVLARNLRWPTASCTA